MYKIVFLLVFMISSILSADLVPFTNDGYVSTYAAQNLSPKSHNKKIGRYDIYISYDILAKWTSNFLMGDPVFYADYVYKIKKVTIYVSDTSSKYALMGASTTTSSVKHVTPFISEKESNFLKSLVRISGLKIRVKFSPINASDVEFIIDGGVGSKNQVNDKYIYMDSSDNYFYRKSAELYNSIAPKYRSFNTKGSPKWEDLFLGNFTKQESIDIVKKKGYFSANIEDVKIDYSRLISFVENRILSQKQQQKEIKSSLMLLIDASGSMRGTRFSAAKSAAITNAKKAISKNVEVSVAFFGGECSDTNVLHVHDFTLDANSLESFIQNATIMGGTPLSLALKQANEYLYAHKSKSSKSETVLLLGDGEGSCGNIQSVIDNLKSNNTFAHHETIGLEVGTSSNASSQLANIAYQSGGNYHTSNSVADLERVFEDASDIEELSDMIGSFGNVNNQHKNMSSNNSMQSILNGFDNF